MHKTAWLVCRSFLEKHYAGKLDSFHPFLPESIHALFSSFPPPSCELCQGYQISQELLSCIHPSWIAAALRKQGKKQIQLLVAALPQDKRLFLEKELLLSPPLPLLSQSAQIFLQQTLANELCENVQDLIPIRSLQQTPLYQLLELSTPELCLLIGFLGLRDLAVDMRQIIDKTHLKKIQQILPKEREFYLHTLLMQKEPIIFPKLPLQELHSAPKLLQALHQRGMNRLAKATFSLSPTFLWYLTHKLSIEDSLLFSSYHKDLASPTAQEVLQEQVLEVLHFFKKHNLRITL